MIFITGGTGLVGSHLLIQLLQSGLRVKALCRPESDLGKVSDLFKSYGPETWALFPKIQWVEGDLNDLPSLLNAFKEVTEVYHCAALISFNPKDSELLRNINHIGTKNIVNLCLKKKVKRLYYCSSTATIGGIRSPLTENDLWNFAVSNVYATSKHLAEMEVWRGGQEGLETIIVNPGVIFGPGFWNQGSGLFFTSVYSGLKYAPPGSTGFVGVWDVVKSFEAITHKKRFNQRFILVAENLKYSEVLTQIADVLNVSAPKRQLKQWQLECLWRMDWIRATFTGKPRKLSRITARNLRIPKRYSSGKVKELTGLKFQSMKDVISQCGDHFPQKGKGTQS